ncbi:unnamed protein product [Prunus armeniaca]|uniref:Uncharacterized protein n=1 Tax=Prunus armeniaca TaxID=36596 RepID=A0A6J5TX22_PRUAR|nr:unnamed protein product [Prunus armeniaca]CAB4298117.1 unnamed protein product [Prunus armeniaca]
MGACVSSVSKRTKGKTRKSSKAPSPPEQQSTDKTVDIPEVDEHSSNGLEKGNGVENGGAKEQDVMSENGSLPQSQISLLDETDDYQFSSEDIPTYRPPKALDTISEESEKSDVASGLQRALSMKEYESVNGGDKNIMLQEDQGVEKS